LLFPVIFYERGESMNSSLLLCEVKCKFRLRNKKPLHLRNKPPTILNIHGIITASFLLAAAVGVGLASNRAIALAWPFLNMSAANRITPPFRWGGANSACLLWIRAVAIPVAVEFFRFNRFFAPPVLAFGRMSDTISSQKGYYLNCISRCRSPVLSMHVPPEHFHTKFIPLPESPQFLCRTQKHRLYTN
jgi:hypothetical protein